MKKTDIRKAIFWSACLLAWVLYVKLLRITVDPPVWQYAATFVAWGIGSICFAVGPFYTWLYPEEK